MHENKSSGKIKMAKNNKIILYREFPVLFLCWLVMSSTSCDAWAVKKTSLCISHKILIIAPLIIVRGMVWWNVFLRNQSIVLKHVSLSQEEVVFYKCTFCAELLFFYYNLFPFLAYLFLANRNGSLNFI